MKRGMIRMFSNIGRKVRGVAVALCAVGILGSLGAGVFLYLTKLMQLILCIAIAVGGAVVSWLISWVLYCVGDTHVRIERLEDKLIPKPSYAEYLSGNAPLRGPCEICGMTTDLINAKIEDKLGVRYRRVCKDCFAAKRCQEAE